MRSLFALIALLALAPIPTHATIYLVDTDAATRSVGMLTISSGPVVTYKPSPMSGLKGVGFVGWSGNAGNVNPEMDKQVLKLMQASTPTDKIEAFVDSKIHNLYSRYTFVNFQGLIGHVFPPRGCQQPECDARFGQGNQYFVMGGGLNHDVVAKTVEGFARVHATNLPLECKLLLGMQIIINVGGEIEEFEEARIATDDPRETAQNWYASTVGEAQVINDFRAQMGKKNISCPAARNAVWLKAKRKRDPHSIDL